MMAGLADSTCSNALGWHNAQAVTEPKLDDDKLVSHRDKAHRSWCRTGHLNIALAETRAELEISTATRPWPL